MTPKIGGCAGNHREKGHTVDRQESINALHRALDDLLAETLEAYEDGVYALDDAETKLKRRCQDVLEITADYTTNEDSPRKGGLTPHTTGLDMLAALAGCADMLCESAKQHRLTNDSGHAEMCTLHMDAARAAIAKAKGETA